MGFESSFKDEGLTHICVDGRHIHFRGGRELKKPTGDITLGELAESLPWGTMVAIVLVWIWVLVQLLEWVLSL